MTICTEPGCTRSVWDLGRCGKHGRSPVGLRHTDYDGPLVCTCPTPAPTGTDQCDRCKRVIANLIHQRRAQRQP